MRGRPRPEARRGFETFFATMEANGENMPVAYFSDDKGNRATFERAFLLIWFFANRRYHRAVPRPFNDSPLRVKNADIFRGLKPLEMERREPS